MFFVGNTTINKVYLILSYLMLFSFFSLIVSASDKCNGVWHVGVWGDS